MTDHPRLTKGQRRRLRELEGMAYRRELARELSELEAQFARWRRDEIDEFELSDLIHKFHQGPARTLWSRYDGRGTELSVAHAIVTGLVTEAEAGPDVLALLARHIHFYRHIDDPIETIEE